MGLEKKVVVYAPNQSDLLGDWTRWSGAEGWKLVVCTEVGEVAKALYNPGVALLAVGFSQTSARDLADLRVIAAATHTSNSPEVVVVAVHDSNLPDVELVRRARSETAPLGFWNKLKFSDVEGFGTLIKSITGVGEWEKIKGENCKPTIDQRNAELRLKNFDQLAEYYARTLANAWLTEEYGARPQFQIDNKELARQYKLKLDEIYGEFGGRFQTGGKRAGLVQKILEYELRRKWLVVNGI